MYACLLLVFPAGHQIVHETLHLLAAGAKTVCCIADNLALIWPRMQQLLLCGSLQQKALCSRETVVRPSSSSCLGIVREVYSKWERRAPLCPSHVRELTKDGIKVLVQPSKTRIFSDKEYEDAGAVITNDVSEAQVILGVKQVPVEELLADKTYMFFSHTIKGQIQNMPLLEACLQKNVRLVDYECITKDGKSNGKRLIAFGSWAGRAGMINALRGLGERLLALGISSPFLHMGSSYMYSSFEEARRAVLQVGEAIRTHGIAPELAPFVVVFTSNGKASRGAQEVFELLPHQWVHASELAHLPPDRGKLFGCVVTAQDTAKHREDAPFDRQEYYQHGAARYESAFHRDIAPYASTIVNCTYWDDRYPRLLTKQDMQVLHAEGNTKLLAVADISCDVRGSVEMLERTSTIERPFYRYSVANQRVEDDLDGDGVLMMGVDILPSELPREASRHFGDLLTSMVRPLLQASPDATMQELDQTLTRELLGAVITNKGSMTPRFAYIMKLHDKRKMLSSSLLPAQAGAQGSANLLLRGHLFDSGLINRALDVLEHSQAMFQLVECQVQPNPGALVGRSDKDADKCLKSVSSAVLRVRCTDRAALDRLVRDLGTLIAAMPEAEAALQELSDSYAPTASSGPSSIKDAAAMGVSTEPVHYQRRKQVVCLGAGLVSQPLVEYLSRDSNVSVLVISSIPGEAQAIAAKARRSNVTARTADVLQDLNSFEALFASSDCVVSLLPAAMHVPVAEACLRARAPLVTASYVSEEMQALHHAAMDAGIPILCEMGLDPGIDHMSAMQMIAEATREGGEVQRFASWCGGLPSPEAADNPLRYKFSWSPRGVLTASQNSARYMREGDVVVVAGKDLLASAEPVDFLPAFAFEALPNRDAIKYAHIYGIPDVSSIYRGTLRYAGFSRMMHEMSQMRLLDMTPTSPTSLPPSEMCPRTWRDLMASKLIDSEVHISEETRKCLDWLGAYSERRLGRKRGWSVADEFCSLLQARLSYAEQERDMVAMRHEVDVRLPDGTLQTRTCTLVRYGEAGGTSFMSSSVGLTAAVGAHLILSGKLTSKGVLRPTIPQVYDPALELLRNEGIEFVYDVSVARAPTRRESRADTTESVQQSAQLVAPSRPPPLPAPLPPSHSAPKASILFPFVSAREKMSGHQD